MAAQGDRGVVSRSTASAPPEPTVAADPAPRVGPWFAIVGLLLVAAMLAASFVQISQRALLKQALLNQDDYLVLSLYPLESEYERLRAQWRVLLTLPAGGGPTSEAMQALQLRYDIFVSRVSLMQTARAQRLLNAVPQAQALVDGLARFIAHGDDYLGQPSKAMLDSAAARDLLVELDALAQGLHQVLVEVTQQVAAQVAERQETLRRHSEIGLALTGSLLALMLLFAAIALRQMRRLERHRQRQQHLATALREARIQAERANDAKGQFLADLSHAMRTPLNGLLGMLGLLKDSAQDPRASQWLSAADESAAQLLRSLDGMLKHSPGASGNGAISNLTNTVSMPSGIDSAATAQAPAAGLDLVRHVLVVEDHPINRQYMAAVLARMGQRCKLAENGLQALRMVQQDTFDLVLMDVHMPVMDGVEATRAIRALGGTPGGTQVGAHGGAAARTPIVALTADVFEDTERRCRQAGVDQVLTKPISHQALAQLLAQWPPRAAGLAVAPAGPSPVSSSGSDGAAHPRLIDPAVVLSVRDLMGAERLPSLYQGLFDQARDSTRRMREAMRQADLLALRRAAHAVKGAALNFGLPALADAADVLSRTNDHAPAPQLALAVQRFDELVEATQALCAAEGLTETLSLPSP